MVNLTATSSIRVRVTSYLKVCARIVFELSYLLWFELLILDWLISTSDPYPYAAAVESTISVASGLALALWLKLTTSSKASRFICQAWAVLLILGSAYCLTWPVLMLTIAVGVLMGMLSSLIGSEEPHNNRAYTARIAIYVLWIAFAVCFYVPFAAAVPSARLTSWSDNLIGNGLQGCAGAHPGQFAAVLLNQWGIVGLAIVGIVVATGLVNGALALLRTNGGKLSSDRMTAICVSMACIIGLLYEASSTVPFLTTSSVGGTCLLALSLSTIGVATSEPRAKAASPRKLPTGRRSIYFPKVYWVAVGALLCLAAACLEIYVPTRIRPYVGFSTPARYKEYTPLSGVSPLMQDATVAMEDHSFYRHHGFDWVAMHHALRVDIRDGRIVEGGSTITQQLAKNLFLTDDRTVWRKIQEAAYTVQLEHVLSKRRILEIYLNTIDYGYGRHGITAAAMYYFHETPDKLNLAQSALLVGLVPNPPQIDPAVEQGEPQYEDLSSLESGQQTAIGRMRYFFPHRYTQTDADEALSIPLDRLVYPYKDAWDRGATETIPGTWHNVDFYFFADPEEPSDINNVAQCLLPHLAAFLDEAHSRYGLVGIDHLGVYNDRGMRQAATVLSAHAYGQAIDISGFRFSDGRHVAVKDHNDPTVLRRLAQMERLLKRNFAIVVDWKDDPLRHQTHFHCEVLGPRPTGQRPVVSLADEVSAQEGEKKAYAQWIDGEEVRQTHPMSCGAASLATVLNFYVGRPTTESDVMRMIGTDGNSGIGTSDLVRACHTVHVRATESVLTLGELEETLGRGRLPVITVVLEPDGGGHFVDVVGEIGGNLMISDPNSGNYSEPVDEFCKKWTGDAVVFASSARH